MAQIRFEWDEAKNLANQRKHSLRFEEAIHVFRDPLRVSVHDRIEDGEERWQTFGLVGGVLLLMVAHTVREEDAREEVIRVISARRATAKERRRYEEEND
ncbi:MAG: BrnT family toxin [Acidobacteriota bacterium]|nr:BrnT family toxin [Acidobacteriota bacterium]